MRSSVFTLALASAVAAQTFTDCNPLENTCPADPALGGHANFDFKSKSDRFTSTGGEPNYGNDGAVFTIAQKGQSPTIGTKFYIMFGHVDIQLKASPGTGIVSSAILQSDDLDEIDWEWLGGDNGNVQTNYFGKGITGNYDRGAIHPVANVQGEWHTYGLDWTKDRIQWSIDGNVVRTLTPKDADNGDQYPQSPMNVRIGSWAGGATDNPGTIAWAGGITDFSKGPFSMLVKSLSITDYSTGNSYSYSDHSGSWQSIRSDGGKINGVGSPNEGDNVIDNPSTAEQTGMPHFPDFVPPHPTTQVTHPLIWPWVPAASATATATGNALGGVVVESGAECLKGKWTFLTRPGNIVTGVSTQVTASSKPKETTHEFTTTTSPIKSTTTPKLPATTTSTALGTLKTMTIVNPTSSVHVHSTLTTIACTTSAEHVSNTVLTTMGTSSPEHVSNTMMTTLSTTFPAHITSTYMTSIPVANPSSIMKSTTLVVSHVPTLVVSQVPTLVNSQVPTLVNSQVPTLVNSQVPTLVNSQVPTLVNSQVPTLVNSQVPTLVNSQVPTLVNSQVPTLVNSQVPTLVNSQVPTLVVSQVPTLVASQTPTTGMGAAASAAATPSGSSQPSFEGNPGSSASSFIPAAPLNTANTASGLRIPGAALALGMLAVFA